MAKLMTLLAVFVAGSSYAAAPAVDTPASRMRSAVDRAAGEYMADRCRVGLSVVARVDGRTFFFNYGSVRRDQDDRPSVDSVYELASVTKTFTGALAAQALLQRRMTLDGDFRIHLSGSYPNLAAAGRPITLRSLATHTSGLQRDLPDSDALMAKPDYDHIGDQLAVLNRGYSRSGSLGALHQVTLRTPPGSTFAYSNIGIRLIGYGLETAYHMPIGRLMQRSIFGPLKMKDTTFTPSRAMRARMVTPYNRFGHVQPDHDSSAGAAYGLYSTPKDMGRYLAWQLNAHDPVIARSHAPLRGTVADGQGLIWNIGRDGNEAMLWHGGGSFGETSQIVIYPDSGSGFVLLANDACEGSETGLKTVATSVHGALRHAPIFP